MKMFDDYIILPDESVMMKEEDKGGDDYSFIVLEATNDESPIFGWRFKIYSLGLEEKKETDDAVLQFNYDILHPEELPEDFITNDDGHSEVITNFLGECLLNIIEEALKNDALKFPDEEHDKENGEKE